MFKILFWVLGYKHGYDTSDFSELTVFRHMYLIIKLIEKLIKLFFYFCWTRNILFVTLDFEKLNWNNCRVRMSGRSISYFN